VRLDEHALTSGAQTERKRPLPQECLQRTRGPLRAGVRFYERMATELHNRIIPHRNPHLLPTQQGQQVAVSEPAMQRPERVPVFQLLRLGLLPHPRPTAIAHILTVHRLKLPSGECR